ncbi:acetyl-CoA carboxylase biotin carboxyl carrier protein [Leptolyngbya sp. FACHB-711]|uniref:acetyl-CoA carboxylase biotin carboxyl carrier protein n=1 Tax=unclassified Leptolyngbya TaxID=2650499 RepID=UPI001682BBD5|nr:acetyl-CoA carboxylase biotin carboxyl carrier protein [Cyanobacteria bacterium FACHB-502]MBD2024264.1 acetyl-CoA carboxylase biotin carboxyl carrier protein [Leptolyngbya sp. FACHB-711]
MELNFSELRDLLTVINQTDIAEFTLKSGDFELVIRKGVQPGDTPATSPAPSTDTAVALAPIPSLPSASATPIVVPPTPTPPPRSTEKFVEIVSPMVGTFYRAPAPDEAAFVNVGDRVRNGQTVCIIEAMKLMNEIEAEISGEIVEILVQNGEPVEFGQPLMRVNPA